MISASPLCPHIEQGSAANWLRALPVRPKAVKVFSPGACRAVKAIDPAITTIMRRFVPDQEAYLNQGVEGGRRFVREQADLEGVDILEGYGIYVRVYHDLRSTLGVEYRSWYGHMAHVLVEEGMEVKAGQTPLGHAGTTGNSTGIHLHLTFQQVGLHNGMVVDGAIDPEPHF